MVVLAVTVARTADAFLVPAAATTTAATTTTSRRPPPTSRLPSVAISSLAEEDREALLAEQEADRRQAAQIRERIKEQQHHRLQFAAAVPDLGGFADGLIEAGALEVSCLPSNPAALDVTLPAEASLEDVVQLAARWQDARTPHANALPAWTAEPTPLPDALNWYRAAQEPGFAPVVVGLFQVVPAQGVHTPPPPPQHQIRILPGEGWGDGQHPTTRLCLEFLSQEGIICGGERVIDYGCGSGILSIAAIQLGAREAVGIDVCYDALASAKTNVQLNGVEQEIDLIHPREVVPSDFVPGDVVIANILVGTLLAMSNTIIGAVKPGGWLVLSGLRPEQVQVVKEKYADNVKWEDSLERQEEVTNPTFGTGAGLWMRIVGRRVAASGWVEALSEAAVS